MPITRIDIRLLGRLWLLALLVAAAGCASEKSHRRSSSYQTVSDAPARDSASAAELTAQATDLMDRGDLAQAERLFKEALTADVTHGPAHNNLGKLYYKKGKHYLAAWEFQYAIKLMPNHPQPKNNLGMVLEEVGKLDEAVRHYQQALALERDNVQVIGNLARAHVRRGDRDERVRDLLTELTMKDRRTEWVEWAKEQLALMGGPSQKPLFEDPGVPASNPDMAEEAQP